MSLLEARNIAFSYGNGAVLKHCSFSVHPGSVLQLRGASGVGKSTLLRLLARLEVPTRGSFRFRGTPYDAHDPHALRRSVAFLPQLPVMCGGSVRENLLLSFHFGSHRGAVPTDDQLCALMRDLALDTDEVTLSHSARELSVGQQQRIAFIRLLLMEPSVLLLDEPLAPLDAESAAAFTERLRAFLLRGETAVVVASHQALVIRDVPVTPFDLQRPALMETAS